tara:strand:+ start:1917 stop:2609 length:693 start_codon:yes stop_codon:yes gene_type:complete
MMLENYIRQKQQRIAEEQNSFYTPTGIHVFFQQPVEGVNAAAVISKVEEIVPHHILSEVEMIIFGWFQEFEERSLEAFFQGGTLYISNMQTDVEGLFENIVHEVAHAAEVAYGFDIYNDNKIQQEFLRKREHLHDILWKSGFKFPKSFFTNIEYDKEFDDLLFQKIGYDKLNQYASGLFISSYAATSLREYFATAFTDFYTNSNHNFLKKVSPEAYNKIMLIQNPESLDF